MECMFKYNIIKIPGNGSEKENTTFVDLLPVVCDLLLILILFY